MSKQPNRVLLENVRIAFAKNLFTAGDFQGNGVMKYSSVFLFPASHPANEAIKRVSIAVSKEKWGEKASQTYKGLAAQDRLAIHDGDAKAEFAGYEGNMYVNASSNDPVRVLDRNKTPLNGTEGRPYSGCYVDAIVDLWAQDNQWGKRINASLMAVRFREDGERLAGGGTVSDDEFETLEGEEEVDSAEDLFD